jgi:hypothetical protein
MTAKDAQISQTFSAPMYLCMYGMYVFYMYAYMYMRSADALEQEVPNIDLDALDLDARRSTL